MTQLSKRNQKMVRGKAIVRALCASQRGVSDGYVPEGATGYVLGGALRPDMVVFWPDIEKQYSSDTRVSTHKKEELQVIGRAS